MPEPVAITSDIRVPAQEAFAAVQHTGRHTLAECLDAALAAAWPLIAASERERFRRYARALTDGSDKELATAYDQAMAAGTSAERERIAALAESVRATWLKPCNEDDLDQGMHTHHRVPFADLLREEAP
jgi:hypothetical protein